MQYIFNFLLLLVMLLVFSSSNKLTTDYPAGGEKITNAGKALHQYTEKLLGAKLGKGEVKVVPFSRIGRWSGIPDPIYKKARTGQYKRILFVKSKIKLKKLRKLIFEAEKDLKSKFNIDLAIFQNAYNTNDENEEEWRICNNKTCMPNGGCKAIEMLIKGECRDRCSSNNDCNSEGCWHKNCYSGSCQGRFVGYMSDCPPDACNSSNDCAEEGANTTCIVKICMDDICWTDYIEIDDEAQSCPEDECDTHEDCGGDGLGMFEEIEDAFGW